MPLLATLFLLSLLALSPVFAADTVPSIETDLQTAMNAITTGCKSTSDPDACILLLLQQERASTSLMLDTVSPAAWPDADLTRFNFFHIMLRTAEAIKHCDTVAPADKQSCTDLVPLAQSRAGAEARQLVIAKRTAYDTRRAAELQAQDRQLQRHAVEAQRDQERELMQIQAAGMILQGYAFRGGPLSNSMQQAPVSSVQPVVPLYTPAPMMRSAPPVSCSSTVVGGYTHTSCY